jgi:hypothetical protein
MSFARNCVWIFFVAGFFLSPSVLLAELDKDAVEKKEATEILPELGNSEDYQRRLIEEGEKNLGEINKLLDQIQEGMAGRKTGTLVQGKQKEVVERLDKLIENLGKCSSCSSSSGQSSEKKSQQQGQQKSENEERQASSKNQKMEAQQQKSEEKKSRTEKNEEKGKVANNRAEDAPPPDAKAGSLRDRISQARRWGVLPSKIAESMLFSGGKEAPHEYREIISRYYKRMTEMHKGGSGK